MEGRLSDSTNWTSAAAEDAAADDAEAAAEVAAAAAAAAVAQFFRWNSRLRCCLLFWFVSCDACCDIWRFSFRAVECDVEVERWRRRTGGNWKGFYRRSKMNGLR